MLCGAAELHTTTTSSGTAAVAAAGACCAAASASIVGVGGVGVVGNTTAAALLAAAAVSAGTQQCFGALSCRVAPHHFSLQLFVIAGYCRFQDPGVGVFVCLERVGVCVCQDVCVGERRDNALPSLYAPLQPPAATSTTPPTTHTLRHTSLNHNSSLLYYSSYRMTAANHTHCITHSTSSSTLHAA